MKPTLPSTELLGSLEIQIHYKRPLYASMKHITRADDAVKIIREFSDSNRIDLKEFFWVIYLSNANRLIGISEISIGNTVSTIIGIKEIFQGALLSNAVGMILIHNHPSGDLRFSNLDKELTWKIYELAKIMEVTLLDHIVITSEGFHSFSNAGLFEGS